MGTTPEVLLQNLLNYVNRNNSFLLPGEGARILNFLHDFIVFINNSKVAYSTVNITHSLFSTVDRILIDQNSLLNSSVSWKKSQKLLISSVILQHLRLLEEVLNKYTKYLVQSPQKGSHFLYRTIDISILNVSDNNTAGVYQIPYWTHR